MSTKFERLNHKLNRYRGWYLIGFGVFLIAWLVRSALRISKLDGGVLNGGLIAILIISVAAQALFTLKGNLLKVEMQKDPLIREMLADELVRLNELKAWRTAFFALTGYIIVVAILSLWVSIPDLMLVLITALLFGFGTYNATAYCLNR